MNIVVVKYNAGNIYSVIHALKRLGASPLLTDDARLIEKADKVIFPGQGEASNAMSYLIERGLDKVMKNLTQPVLGICIGQQLLCRYSEEGRTSCLGVFDTEVKRFVPTIKGQKVPHMGWNQIHDLSSPLLKGIEENAFVYFVHSYYVPVSADTIATTDYIAPFSAALHKNNFYATQFHPEKSGDIGEIILRNFLQL